MRIGIDARPLSWATEGGISVICSNLIRQLALQSGDHEIVVFSNGELPEIRHVEFRIVTLPGGLARYSGWELPAALRHYGCDALLSLSPEVYRHVIPTVLLVYDIYPMMYEQWLSPGFMFSMNYWRHRLQTRFRLASARRLEGLLALSQCTSDDFRHYVGKLDSPMRVALPGVDAELCHNTWTAGEAKRLVVEQLKIECPFFLYVGAINRQKNVQTIIQAHSFLRARTGLDVALVLVGHPNWPPIDAGDLNGRQGIVQLPWLSKRELGALYASAIALIHLSLYEGFGMTVLEAMSCGTPVIVSNCGSLPEVVGNAGVICEPSDVASVVDAMELLLFNPEEQARQSMLSSQRSANFSWENMAAIAIRLIEDVVH